MDGHYIHELHKNTMTQYNTVHTIWMKKKKTKTNLDTATHQLQLLTNKNALTMASFYTQVYWLFKNTNTHYKASSNNGNIYTTTLTIIVTNNSFH